LTEKKVVEIWKSLFEAFHSCAEKGHFEVLQNSVANRADVDKAEQSGCTPSCITYCIYIYIRTSSWYIPGRICYIKRTRSRMNLVSVNPKYQLAILLYLLYLLIPIIPIVIPIILTIVQGMLRCSSIVSDGDGTTARFPRSGILGRASPS
jgi:hypothetical protein